MRVDERFVDEESLRMSLVLNCPHRMPTGRVHDRIVTHVDFARDIGAVRRGTCPPGERGA